MIRLAPHLMLNKLAAAGACAFLALHTEETNLYHFVIFRMKSQIMLLKSDNDVSYLFTRQQNVLTKYYR